MEMLCNITSLLIELNAFSASIMRTASILPLWKRSCVVWIAASVGASWPEHTCNAPGASRTSFLATYITNFPAIPGDTSLVPTGSNLGFLSSGIKPLPLSVYKVAKLSVRNMYISNIKSANSFVKLKNRTFVKWKFYTNYQHLNLMVHIHLFFIAPFKASSSLISSKATL